MGFTEQETTNIHRVRDRKEVAKGWAEGNTNPHSASGRIQDTGSPSETGCLGVSRTLPSQYGSQGNYLSPVCPVEKEGARLPP